MLGQDGAASGSTAITRYFRPPRNVWPRNGKVSPAKFEPPPAQAMITSGSSPASAICWIASRPTTLWWSRTWLRTEPRLYFVSSRVAASSTASLIAMPSEPGLSGCSASTARP